jgi:hypothetical protein
MRMNGYDNSIYPIVRKFSRPSPPYCFEFFGPESGGFRETGDLLQLHGFHPRASGTGTVEQLYG